MTNRSIVLAALIFAICANVASAQGVPGVHQAVTSDEPRVISLQLMSTPILQALDTLLKGTGRTYRIDEDVRVSGAVSVSLQDVPLDNAVQIVLRSAGLQAAREGQIYVIKRMALPAAVFTKPQQTLVPMQMPRPSIGTVDVKPSGTQTGGQKFDILLDKANVLDAMKQILDVAHQNYVIDTGLDAAWAGPLGPRISSRMRGIALDEAIQALGKSASLVVAKVGTTYTVRPPDGAMPFSYTGAGKGSSGRVETQSDKSPGTASCAKCGCALVPAWLYCPQCATPVRAPAALVPGVSK